MEALRFSKGSNVCRSSGKKYQQEPVKLNKLPPPRDKQMKGELPEKEKKKAEDSDSDADEDKYADEMDMPGTKV